MSLKPYQRSVRFVKHEKYHILNAKSYHSVNSFDEKLYICETCHRHLYKSEASCRTVCHEVTLDPTPNEF